MFANSHPNTLPATSTLILKIILDSSSSLSDATYALDPSSPLSSEPHHINLIVLFGGLFLKSSRDALLDS